MAKVILRNLMPYYLAGIGIHIDSSGRFCNRAYVKVGNNDYQSDWNNLMFSYVLRMFGYRVGIEQMPRGLPTFNQMQWKCDGAQTIHTYLQQLDSSDPFFTDMEGGSFGS